jgi:hypothetical protein
MLRVVTDSAAGRISYVQQLQITMGAVLVCGLVVLALHAYITAKFPTNRDQINDAVIAKAKRLALKKEHLSRSETGEVLGCMSDLDLNAKATQVHAEKSPTSWPLWLEDGT